MKFDIVIFDLEGTIADTIADMTNAINHALSVSELPPLSVENVKKYAGKDPRLIIDDLLVRNDKDITSSVKAFTVYYAEHFADNVKLYDKVLETLRDIPARKVIYTNKNIKMVEKILSKLGIRDMFTEILTPDNHGAKKPDPSPILKLSKKYGIAPEKMIFVGDSIIDFECAKNAGVVSIGVNYGYGDPDDLKYADIAVDEFVMILKHI